MDRTAEWRTSETETGGGGGAREQNNEGSLVLCLHPRES